LSDTYDHTINHKHQQTNKRKKNTNRNPAPNLRNKINDSAVQHQQLMPDEDYTSTEQIQVTSSANPSSPLE